MSDQPTFALIGVAGYVAPKHGAAIKAVGGRLVAACDVHDAVGWLDKDWPECEFYLAEDDEPRIPKMPSVDWYVIATENGSHPWTVKQTIDRANVICEKPLALRSSDLLNMTMNEQIGKHRVYTILNLRHHPEILRAKRVAEEDRPRLVTIGYCAPRGPWYDVSWKGDPARSGGIVFNIGIHILDFLVWALGPASEVPHVRAFERGVTFETVHKHALYPDTRCIVSLTTHPESSPMREIVFQKEGGGACEVFDLAAPFSLADDGTLHEACYREILAGRGPGIEEARPSIELAERIAGLV